MPGTFGSKKSSGAGIGYGKRFREGILVDRTHTVPSPQAYIIPSTITNVKKTFGVSREKYEKAVVRGDTQADKANPGPGSYNRPGIDGGSRAGSLQLSSFKGQCGRIEKNSIFDNSAKNYPGPTHYYPNNNLTATTDQTAISRQMNSVQSRLTHPYDNRNA